jgi:hypothetical protein
MDSRAYYIPGIESISHFEVDHPKVINKKREKINKILGKLLNHTSYVPTDFEKHDLSSQEISDYPSKCFLSLIKDVGSEELEKRYIKLANLDLQVKVFDIERIALVAVGGALYNR